MQITSAENKQPQRPFDSILESSQNITSQPNKDYHEQEQKPGSGVRQNKRISSLTPNSKTLTQSSKDRKDDVLMTHHDGQFEQLSRFEPENCLHFVKMGIQLSKNHPVLVDKAIQKQLGDKIKCLKLEFDDASVSFDSYNYLVGDLG